MVKHPFNAGTRLAKIFTILSDGKWHCGKHELPGTQPAKAIQVIRQNGFHIEKKTQYCTICQDKTVHRQLISTKPIKPSFIRLQIPAELRKRTLKYYNNAEAITQRRMLTTQLEIDHRFPQVRWAKDEIYNPSMSENEIRDKFQLLTRAHNLWKSRYCEHCKKTDERGTFIGINYFYSGGSKWDEKIPSDDEKGCVGCFWYDPDTWRASLNVKLRD